jgi:hypothetical protein
MFNLEAKFGGLKIPHGAISLNISMTGVQSKLGIPRTIIILLNYKKSPRILCQNGRTFHQYGKLNSLKDSLTRVPLPY